MGWGVVGGLAAGGGLCTGSSAVSSTSDKNRHSLQGRLRQSLAAPQLFHSPCSAPSWIERAGEKPSVKADLAIFSYVIGMCW